jgi:hypothetical protein
MSDVESANSSSRSLTPLLGRRLLDVQFTSLSTQKEDGIGQGGSIAADYEKRYGYQRVF